MPSKSQATCWVVTDGKSGMENQCLGLAEALGLAPVIKRVKLRAPWRELAPWLRWGLNHAFDKVGDPLAPPWPDLLIATGRSSIPASLYVKSVHPKTFTVQLQDPVISPAHFDLVVVPGHDQLQGKNVLHTQGALHRVTKDILLSAAEKLRPQVAHLPRPFIAVLVGGSNAVYRLTPKEMNPLADQLAALAKTTGGSLLITPSRRTGAENLMILQDVLKGTSAYIWDGEGENPYFGMLGLADYILTTCDSVNMVSEAATTGKPVYVIDLPGGSSKFRRFHQTMYAGGYARPFKGALEVWAYEPLGDVSLIAAKVREGIERRISRV